MADQNLPDGGAQGPKEPEFAPIGEPDAPEGGLPDGGQPDPNAEPGGAGSAPEPKPKTSFFNEEVIQLRLNELKEAGTEVKFPEGFNELPANDQLKFMKENLFVGEKQTIESDDPFVSNYLKAKEQGLSADQFLEQQKVIDSVKNMNSRDFLISMYSTKNLKTDENPNGWTKEQIEEYVDGLPVVQRDLEAEKGKSEYYSQIEESNSTYKQRRADAIAAKAEELNKTEIAQEVDELFQTMSSEKEIGGIPHTAEDIADFKAFFTEAVSINPVTGYPRTREIFGNNKVLYTMLWNLFKSGDVKELRSIMNESYKQGILDKTSIAPKKTGGQQVTVAVPSPEDFV